MSLDADVAAVVDGSRLKVRGILRLPARPPPSYSAVASRQAMVAARSNSPTARHTTPQPDMAALTQPQWQTAVTRRRGDKRETSDALPTVEGSVAMRAEAVGDKLKAESARRKKKKAGEPPPPTLNFAELLEAQLRRVEEKKKSGPTTETDDRRSNSTVQPSTSVTVSVDPPTSAATSQSALTAPPTRAVSKQAKPTKLKRQMRERQLHTFIREHVLAPIIRAVVTQTNSDTAIAGAEAHQDGVSVESGGGSESEESERRGKERRDKKRMLRQIKRKQKRMDKQAGNDGSTDQRTHHDSSSHPLVSDARHDDVEENGVQEEQEHNDAGDGLTTSSAERSLPSSQAVHADEDPSCPTQPYSFTDEERAFLFQHVVVDRYHSQPPLPPLVSALCQQLFTPSVDSPVAHLLLALASYQRRALSSPSPLVRARGRRMVMGLREATKRLKQNKLLLLILPHNVETAHPMLAAQLAALYFQCVVRRVDVVWSLSRRRLANCCGVKGRVAVVGVVSGEGCSELMRSVRERAKEAREAWGVRGWDERVEAGVRERREREEAERELARRGWQEHELEAKREEKKKEKARLEKEIEEANKRDQLLRTKQAERRVQQQRLAVLRREEEQRREQERVVEEAEKAKRKARQERMKAVVKDEEKGGGQQVEKEVGGGKKTWLEEAVEGKEGVLSERATGDGKHGKGSTKGMKGKAKSRR